MPFNTVIHCLQHPRNIGMITRSHVAFGGDKLIFLGYETPWTYCEEAAAYATNLHQKCDILHFKTLDSFFSWSKENGLLNYAIEISETSQSIINFNFSDSCNLILGNEISGLPPEVFDRCDEMLIIPQYGAAGCLNVAIAGSIAIYELMRNKKTNAKISKTKYAE